MEIPIYKVALVREGAVTYATKKISSAKMSAEFFRLFLGNVDREHFMLCMLDSRNKIIGVNTVAIGGLDGVVLDMKSILKPILLSNAHSIIICHNHPSGDVMASQTDKKVTKDIYNACKIMHIKLLDHIILGDGTDQYCSFKEEGFL